MAIKTPISERCMLLSAMQEEYNSRRLPLQFDWQPACVSAQLCVTQGKQPYFMQDVQTLRA